MPQDERKLMLQIFGKIVPEKELDNYLDEQEKMQREEYYTRQDILMVL